MIYANIDAVIHTNRHKKLLILPKKMRWYQKESLSKR